MQASPALPCPTDPSPARHQHTAPLTCGQLAALLLQCPNQNATLELVGASFASWGTITDIVAGACCPEELNAACVYLKCPQLPE